MTCTRGAARRLASRGVGPGDDKGVPTSVFRHLVGRPWAARVGWCSVLVFLLVGVDPPLRAQASEYQVKAVFLFNFAQFVDWPSGAFPDSIAPFVIGVLGDDPFGPMLDDAVRGETVRGHPLEVRRFRKIEDVKTCHILFISSSEERHLDAIVASLRNRSILTVSDAQVFPRHGGMVVFVSEKNHVRLRINPAAAAAADLTISSKLLQAADLVAPGGS